MTKRQRLLQAVRNHMVVELKANIEKWDCLKVDNQVQRIAAINKRIDPMLKHVVWLTTNNGHAVPQQSQLKLDL